MTWPFPDFNTPPRWYMAFWASMLAVYCAFWVWMRRRGK